jgi:carboxyl-terminal processing protease
MPPEVLYPPIDTTAPTATLPAPASVSTETTQNQMRTFSALVDRVSQTYVYPDFNGHDWPALTARYKSLIEGGVNDEGFYQVMGQMIAELGDNHSYFQSPSDVTADDAANSQGQNFVGIGVLANPVAGTGTGVLIAVFPNSPAADAGLRPHDLLLEVDGQAAYDVQTAKSRTLGVEGSSFALKYQRPGEAPQTVTLTRRALSGFLPVGYCIVPNTRIGYILLPTFLDQSIADQVRTALQKMTRDGPLDGLVLDNRENGGGSSSVLTPTLGFFTGGNQGSFVSRSATRAFDITADDVGGSQSVPLVVLAGPETVSFGEVFTGVLQDSGRAKVVGGTTAGNVETLDGTKFDDGSRLWLASEAFAPVGLGPGEWEGKGVVPDVSAPTRWDLFTEANDPALARAIALLQ